MRGWRPGFCCTRHASSLENGETNRARSAILALISTTLTRGSFDWEPCPMAVLKQVTGDLAGRSIELKSDVTVLGRSPECDIVLTTNGVSRRHAEIRKLGDAFLIADLKSLNKTLVN